MIRWFIYHTVASDANDHSPTLLQKTALAGMGVLVVLSFIMSSAHTLLWQYSSWLTGAVLPAVVTSLTNEERAGYAAPALVRSTLLDEAARMKAEHMAAEGYFAHYSPGGISPWFWFDRVGYRYAHAGENLAVHFSDSAAVVDAWMKSPTHKANIINSSYTEIGIGVARGQYEGFDTLFVVQLFGTPAAALVSSPTLSLDTLPERPFLTETVSLENRASTAEASVAGVLDSVEVSTVPTAERVVNEEGAQSTSGTRPDAIAQLPQPETITLVESYGQATTTETPPLMELAATEVSQFSSLSTSSGLVPAVVHNELMNAGTSAPIMATLATQPNTWLRYLYLVIGSLVIFSLLTSVLLSWRRHQPLQVVYGVGLLIVLVGCYYLHTAVTSNVVIVSL